MPHSRLNSKRIAVVIPVSGQKMVVRGVGTVVEDDDNGDVLRVTATSETGDSEEDSAILVRMTPNPPTIERDGKYGCDYCVVLNEVPTVSPDRPKFGGASVPPPHTRKPEIRKPPIRRPAPRIDPKNNRGGR